ncbi:MAG TPA: hypothetical protein VJA21_03980 [Verrucomicrobiae bacterium]
MPLNVRHSSLGTWVTLLSLVILAGCGRNDIQVYRVAKERAQQPQAGMPPGHPEAGAPASASLPRLKYSLPPGWEEAPPGEMRAAAFRVVANGKQADVGVVPLPGLMGRDLETVNRWRSSVGLEAVKEEELPKLAESVEIAGLPGQLFDQGGENPGSGDKTRILAAILRREGVAWFFKMSGDDELVKQQKPAFVSFLKSLTFEAGSPPMARAEAAAPQGLPPSHPPIGDGAAMGAGTGPSSQQTKPVWQVPANWKEANAGGFLVAKFIVTGNDNARADVNVSMSAGEGGGVAMNVNRWRGQLGLGELAEPEIHKLLTPLDTAAGKAVCVDLSGKDARTGQKVRLVGVIIPQQSQTWFYKLMGSEQLVAGEKDGFLKFVQSAKSS